MARELKNVPASVRARLQNLAREQQANFQRVLKTMQQVPCILRFRNPYGWNAHERKHKVSCYGPPGRCEELDGPGLQIPCRRHCQPTGERLFADI